MKADRARRVAGYRLAWDPSAVPTVMVLALAAATRRSLAGSALGFGLCLWTHPTTVFAAPVLAAPWIVARWPRDAGGALRRRSARTLALIGLCLIGGLALAYALGSLGVVPSPLRAPLRRLPARVFHGLTSPVEALRFALLYAEFITGPTLYRYVTGSMPALAAGLHVAGGVALSAAVVVPGLRRLPLATRDMDRALAAGLLLSLVTAYLSAGSKLLEPYTERYGMFLVVPTCYVLAACLDGVAASLERPALARAATAALGVVLAASFVTFFLIPLHRLDLARHDTYRAGPVDPKQAALAEVLARRSRQGATVVSVEDWWIYWPVRYLAGNRSDVRFSIEGASRSGRPFPRDFMLPEQQPGGAEVFGIAWAGSARDAEFAQRSAEHVDVGGYEPRPILRVHRLREAAGAPPRPSR